MAIARKTIELSTGVILEYQEQGDPNGIPMILLHGLSDSCRAFDPVLNALPGSIHAFVPSQRGHGDSSRPEDAYRWTDFTADVLAFMDELELEKVVIVGHSLGSSVGQRFAIDHPERTLGLVLVSSFHSLADHPAPEELFSAVKDMKDPVDPEFVLEFQFITLAQEVPKEFMEQVVRESRKLPARVWRQVLHSSMQDRFANRLGEIQAPTLLVWGDQDEIVSRKDQESLLEAIQAIQGSRLEVYEGAGHAIPWEEPERLASELTSLVRNLTPQAR